MNESNLFDNYSEYVKSLPIRELEDILQNIDKEKFPERYEAVLKEFNSRPNSEPLRTKKGSDYYSNNLFIGGAIFLGLLGFEYYIGKERFADTHIPQLARLALIISLAYVGACFTKKEGVHGFKTTLIFLSAGLVVTAIAAIPRFIDSGAAETLNLMLLKESILGRFEKNYFSFKSNFHLAIGYTLICWALLDNLLSSFNSSKGT